jgi:AhpD family alkylhydroperoxidase
MDFPTFKKRAADVNAAMVALAAAVDGAGLEKELTELVKIRASQLNGCSFCCGFHSDVAARLGVGAAKIDEVADWRASDAFSDRERAALAWAEFLTDSPDETAADDARAALLAHFTGDEAIYLTAAVGTINQWNRIAIGLGFPAPADAGA